MRRIAVRERRIRQYARVPDDSQIVTHSDPALPARSNYIIRVALGVHGMPDRFEQLWARKDDSGYELCSIPYFTYGLSLGDRVAWSEGTDTVEILTKSDHKTVRFAFQDRQLAADRHVELHGQLAESGCRMEFLSDGYGAVDIADKGQERAALRVLSRWLKEGTLSWEWADPAQD